MKIRFTTSIADVRGWSFRYGEVAEVPDEAAQQFIRQGFAEAVGGKTCPKCGHELEDAPETAALANGGERATLPTARKRGA